MNTGFFVETFTQLAKEKEKIEKLGWNTGNGVFCNAIYSICKCDAITVNETFSHEDYDVFISTDLIYLPENVEPWDDCGIFKQFELVGDKPLIPLSVGLQSPNLNPDFVVHSRMVRFISMLAERTTIPVRGEFTAETLARHGIKNLQVVGCPSLYAFPTFSSSFESLFNLPGRPLRAVGSFRPLRSPFSEAELKVLEYLTKNCAGFVEQTFEDLYNCHDLTASTKAWLNDNSAFFFDIEAWRRHLSRFDFGIGCRFHGNVVALWAGKRALFINLDSRTKEMTDYFHLPSIDIEEFDTADSIEYYANIANYDEFQRSYPRRLGDFVSFLARSGVALTPSFEEGVHQFL